MIKSELIQKIADDNPHLFQRDVETIVNVIFNEITDALARGDRVELRGFGAFTVKHRAARTGRNPRTGAPVEVDEKFVPFFKTGKELRERLNENYTPEVAPKKASSTSKSRATSKPKAAAKSGAAASRTTKSKTAGGAAAGRKPSTRSKTKTAAEATGASNASSGKTSKSTRGGSKKATSTSPRKRGKSASETA